MAAGTVYGRQDIFFESVSAVTATNTVALGTLREESGNIYRYCYMANSSQIGYGVMLLSGGSGYTVVASMTTGDLIHGVIQNTTATTATYCWVLKEGLAKIQCGTAGVAATKWVTVLGSGSFGDWAAYQNILNSGATGGTIGTNWANIMGRTLGSAITAGSIVAQIKCL